MKNLVKAAAAAALTAASGMSFAMPSFTIDESIFSADGSSVSGNTINGRYEEVLSVTGANTFSTIAYFNLTTIYNGANSVSSKLDDDYGMYAVFESEGTFSLNGSEIDFTASTGRFALWADRDRDTTKSLGNSFSDGILLSNNSDDELVGVSASLVEGGGEYKPSTSLLTKGSFGLKFDSLSLTALGSQYFIQPDPFYVELISTGDFDEGVSGFGSENFNAKTEGDANVYFVELPPVQVPVPGSAALLGLGLLGLTLKRKKA